VLLILDEAYYEFVEDPAYAGSHELALQSTNVVSSRTFSKVHGIAGFGIAPLGISDYAWRAHVPFSVSILAQAAAEASMGQTRSITERARFMTQEREQLQAAFDETVEYMPSHMNFIPGQDRACSLRAHGGAGARGRGARVPGVEPDLDRQRTGERPDNGSPHFTGKPWTSAVFTSNELHYARAPSHGASASRRASRNL
jgi:aminotransferase class I and II